MLYEYMIELGYSDRSIDRIIKAYILERFNEDSLLKRVKNIYNYLLSLGYSREDIIKMTTKNPTLFANTSISISKKIDDMINYFETCEKEVKKITKVCPSIYGYSIEGIKNRVEKIMELGYKESEVIGMIKRFPKIIEYSIDNMKKKISDMESLGYSKEEVIVMTLMLPTLFGLSIENIYEKWEFYNLIGISDIFIVDTKQLMQSVDLSYARYMFYKSRNIDIGMNNYYLLFMSQKDLMKRYRCSNKELLEEYSYSVFRESCVRSK